MTFENWIENIIKAERPSSDILAYNFGIFETPSGYSLYLIGSCEYDEGGDWACNNDFEPTEKYFPLPNEFSELQWDEVQTKVVEILKGFLTTDLYKDSFLSKA